MATMEKTARVRVMNHFLTRRKGSALMRKA